MSRLSGQTPRRRHLRGTGTIGAENIALWDGATWHALGFGLDQTGYALALDLDLGALL